MKEGWEIKKFADVFDLQMGKTPSRDKSFYWNGDNTWVSIADLNDKKYISESKEGIADSAVKESGIKAVPKNTVIMSFKLSIGKTAITTSQLYTNEAIMAFIVKDKGILIPEFIYYYLKGYKWIGANKAVLGMTLNKKTISEQVFSYPSISEQEKIVAELDCLSGIIEKKKQQLKEYDALAQSIFYEMFGDLVENEKGWKIKKMNEVAKIAGGYAFKSNLFIEEGIPVLRIGNINTGRLKTDSIVFYQEDSALAKYLVYPGDLVMSLTGTVGKDDYGNVCVLDNAYSKYYLNQRNAKFMLSENIQVDYLKYFLKDTQIKSKLTGVNRGVRQGNISNKDIEGLIVPIPPLALQQEFASKIEAIEKQKALIKKSIEEVETLFNSRMDYYFN